MIECSELAGKTIRVCTVYEDGSYGPEIHIEFTDGTSFSACLKAALSIEAKCLRENDGEPQVLVNYSSPAIPR